MEVIDLEPTSTSEDILTAVGNAPITVSKDDAVIAAANNEVSITFHVGASSTGNM